MEQLSQSMGLPQLWICILFTPRQGTGVLWERGDQRRSALGAPSPQNHQEWLG